MRSVPFWISLSILVSLTACATDGSIESPRVDVDASSPTSPDADWTEENDDWDSSDAQLGLCLSFELDQDVSSTVVGAPVSFDVELRNTCDWDLSLQGLELVDHDGAFSFGGALPASVPAGGAVYVPMTFTARGPIIHFAELHIASDDPRAPSTRVELFGQLSDGTRSGAAPTAAVVDKNVYVDLGDVATVDGSASSDPEGDTLTYTWSFSSVPAGSTLASSDITDNGDATASFTPDVNGKYRVRFVVGDGTSTDKVFANVYASSPGNTAPTADAGGNVLATTGEVATVDGSASSDPEGDTLSYTWSFAALPTSSVLGDSDITDNGDGTASFTPDLDGSYNIRLIVSDSSYTDKDFVKVIAFSGTNTAPIANAGVNLTATTGNSVLLDGTGSSDDDGDALTFTWSFAGTPKGSALTNADITDNGDGTANFTPDVDGSYNIRMVVSDGIESDKDFLYVTASAGDTGDTGADDGDGDGFSVDVDCDDANPDAYPGADEYCDGADTDCDDVVDEDGVDAPTWYPDTDGDSYGDELSPLVDCTLPSGYVSDGTDCDDDDISIFPGAPEIYEDGIDQDCDDVDATYTYKSADVQAIVDTECAGCHTGGGASGGVALDDISSSIDTPSSDIPSMDLIEPLDPENSYIYLKITDTHVAAGGAGLQMPRGGSLTAEQIEVFETWILEGAPE